jgi:cytochrome P450
MTGDLRVASYNNFINCPIAEINPSNPDIFFYSTYHRLFERLRSECPVHFCADSDFGAYWSITKYADIVEIESKPELFSSSQGFTIANIPSDTIARSFISMDPPQHRMVRQAVTPMASLSSLNYLTSIISNLICTTLDKIPLNHPFDLVSNISIEITIKVIAIMMGVPTEMHNDLLRWSNIASTVPTPGDDISDLEDYYAQLKECSEFFYDQYQSHSARPVNTSFLSMLAHSAHTKNMSFEELFLNILLLLLAGNDTTRHSITGGALFLDVNPHQRGLFYSDTRLTQSCISEMIRYQTPVAHMRRTATEDIEFRGKKIKKGDKIILWYASGNLDADEIQQPDHFIVNRKKYDHHLAFGTGVHRCIGKNIAILQMRLLWEELIKRGLIINVLAPPVRIRSNIVNGYSSLLVELRRI